MDNRHNIWGYSSAGRVYAWHQNTLSSKYKLKRTV
ncbi:uncharacterized protein METZ01_LOCUS321695 [marine metagenome]|uniref:Uncharacterized protein n=1 Tax=marine metagenome TaxID=408172 RepID=A0A382PAD3_9ZZZZ